jgi:hypothetical protein
MRSGAPDPCRKRLTGHQWRSTSSLVKFSTTASSTAWGNPACGSHRIGAQRQVFANLGSVAFQVGDGLDVGDGWHGESLGGINRRHEWVQHPIRSRILDVDYLFKINSFVA